MFVKLLLMALLATTLTFAQGKKGGGGGGGMGGGSGMGMAAPQRASKLEEFVEKLKLSKEQKEEIQPMLLAALEESKPVRDQMDQGRVAIAGAMIEGKSADDLKKLEDQFSLLAAQMDGIEAKTFGKIYATLKPNQQPKAASAFDLLAEVLEHAGGGGAGGGGREGSGRRGR